MRLLGREREALEALLPGLDARLCEIPFADRESPDAPTIAPYREAGGAGLLIAAELGGRGADPLAAARVQRALGSRSPSLALAATMHNFTVAGLGEYHVFEQDMGELLRAVSAQGLLVASGVAEGRTGQGILTAGMRATRVPGGYRIHGSKKPCSLSRSMDFLTATLVVEPEPDSVAPARRAVALVPAKSEGMSVAPFWSSDLLAGAESDEVILNDVFAPDALVFFPARQDRMDEAEVGGVCWFEVLVSASYLGVASALAERVVETGRGGAAERARLFVELEGAMAAVEGAARALGAGERGQDLLARSLAARYLAQDSIGRAAALAVELLGGLAFIRSPDIGYLLAASRALAFHPPSRPGMTQALAAYLDGAELHVP